MKPAFWSAPKGAAESGFTYKWNAAGTDADLINAGLNESYSHTLPDGSSEQRVWSYPSRQDCITCHNQVSGQALGFRTYHLNSNFHYPSTGRTANQLATFNSLGVFDVNLTDAQIGNFLAARPLEDTTAPLEHRIRSYLDSNCSHCHQPDAVGGGFDARLSTPLDSQNLINVAPDRYEALGHDGRYIKPGNLGLSALNVRLSAVNNGDAMPPLAKNLAHGPGIAALQSYISGLTDAEFASPTAPTARYVRLRSLSGIGGFGYAAVAELNLLDGNGVLIPRSQLSFYDVDLQGNNLQGANGNAYAAIDGSPNSYWETPKNVTPVPGHPHWITLDLGYERQVGGFTYLPKQTSSSNGRIAGYEFLLSNDAVNWTTMTSGVWPDGPALQTYSPPFGKRPARALVAGPATVPGNKLSVTVTFDMDVTDFSATDLVVTGGKVTALRGSGYYYVAEITALAANLSVTVAEDAVNPEGQGSFEAVPHAVTAVPDTIAPTTPSDLNGIATPFSVYLSWTASTDDVGVSAYRILRDGSPVATVTGLSYIDGGLTMGSTYSYRVIALDDGENSSPPGDPVTLTTGEDDLAVYRINAGSTAPYFDSLGHLWLQDDGSRVNTGKIESFPSLVISGTPDPAIYKSNRVTTNSATRMLYSFPVPSGSYEVRLHFAETWSGGRVAGKRVFDVSVEGVLELDDFDIFVATAAPANIIKAHVESIPVVVNDGVLNIQFDKVANNPLISGIEVHLVSLVSPPPSSLAAIRDYRSLGFSWAAPTGGPGVVDYQIHRNNQLIATVTGTTFTDSGLLPGTAYNYQVVARDGNWHGFATRTFGDQHFQLRRLARRQQPRRPDQRGLGRRWARQPDRVPPRTRPAEPGG